MSSSHIADDWVGVGMTLPVDETGISWTAIPLTEYAADMSLRGDDLSRQLRVDVPRMRVLMRYHGNREIRVRSGEVVEWVVRRMLRHEWQHDAMLGLMTQTSLAAPMRALANVIPEGLVVSEHDSERDMTVRIDLGSDEEGGPLSVRVEKTLALRSIETLEMVRDLHLVVEASSAEPFVMVGIGFSITF